MNREDIIAMAREAGFHAWYTQPKEHPDHVAIIERFFQAAYAAGAADEREACAKVCDEADKDSDWPTAANCAAAIRARGQV